MKFRRIFIPVAMIITMLVQFMPGAILGARPVAASSADAAAFVADVTIPDGTVFAPGAAMAKTFRLKNVGTSTWTTDYAIAFTSGSKMGAPSAVNLPTSVAPGNTVDVTVNMTAPSSPGHYRGNWMMRNASNVLFGVGPTGTWVFFIDIVVSSGSPVVAYDFTTNACAAVWTTGAGTLACTGTDGDSRGFVLQQSAPKLETGATGPAGLLTAPQNVTDGYIQGVYPAYTVQSGDHFMSILNCDFGATGCYVTFQLQYQIGSGSIVTLKSFKEKLDGLYYNLNVDLSSLAGQNVTFILKVLATGSPTGDRAVWSGPRIAHGSGGSTPPLSSACDKAAFIADVTIPDGTAMTGGTAFVKTWRLMNVGTCTWTTSYRLVFDAGDYMGVSSSAVNLPTSVAPGATIDLSLNMVAPLSSGTYFSYWRLRNASGVDFGVGAGGTSNFFVKISVSSSYATAYSFTANAGSAAWTSGAGALPFPGTDGDSRGFVLPLGAHTMEDGTASTEGLLTFPQFVTDGFIQGIYPAFAVQNGDHFVSNVGCQYHGPSNCYIIFRLAYQVGGGPVTTLKTAAEQLDGLVYRMDVDLSALAGQNVNFILRVEAFGSASGDRAVWSFPRIIRTGSVPPGPTPTPISPVPTPTGVIVGPSADLSISINDSLGSYTPGGTATYTVVAHNGGPNDVTGASVLVTKPVQITTWTVSCTADSGAVCTAGPITPAGNFTDPVNLPVGKNVTYTIVSTISGGAVGNMVTTATITNPGPTPDPNLANNSSTDTDSPPSADLSITVNDGISVWVPGGTTTYTVVVTNGGPLNVTGAVFNDNKPIQVTGWSWSCVPDAGAVCGAGSGGTITSNIADTANIPSSKKVTYTIVATMTTSVPGNLVNTVTITPPLGTPDPIMTNNTATDTDLGPSADLSVTKTDGVSYYTAGGTLTYTIRVVNNGPQAVIGATVGDSLPSQLSGWTWSCVPDFSSSCLVGSSSIVPFTDTVTIPVGQGVTYTVTANVAAVPTGTLVNTVSASVPPAFLDLVPANNTATDIDAAPTADLAVTKTDGVSIYTPGGSVTYTIVVSNYGPVPVTGAVFTDTLAAPIASWIWTCVADSGASCLAGTSTVAAFSDPVNIPSGKKITYTVVATTNTAGGALTNQAHIAPPAGVPDPILGNNDAVDTDAYPSADLGVTMSDGVATYVVGCGSCGLGGRGTYTIVVTNYGPSAVTAAHFADNMPLQIASWSWTCTPQLGATCLAGTSTLAAFTDIMAIPAGRSVTYTVQYVINAVPPLVLPLTPMTNTATLTAQSVPYSIPDSNATNDSASDVDTPAP